MDQDCEAWVYLGPAAELPDRDGEGDEGGRRQQSNLERGQAACRRKIAAVEDERKST